jgi:hypothetical protein
VHVFFISMAWTVVLFFCFFFTQNYAFFFPFHLTTYIKENSPFFVRALTWMYLGNCYDYVSFSKSKYAAVLPPSPATILKQTWAPFAKGPPSTLSLDNHWAALWHRFLLWTSHKCLASFSNPMHFRYLWGFAGIFLKFILFCGWVVFYSMTLYPYMGHLSLH